MEIEVMDFVEDLCNKESKSCLAYDDFLMETLNKYNFNMDIVKTTKGGRVISIGDFIICPSQRYYINEVISNIGLKKFTCVEGGHSCGKKELLKNVALGFNYAESAQKRIKLGSHIEYRDLVGIHIAGTSPLLRHVNILLEFLTINASTCQMAKLILHQANLC
ncbi:hypothetical protein MXB_647 [Myxobolus squamalis]|nr:hypothetical protein MXB_647 [Myxobolus squamalis]